MKSREVYRCEGGNSWCGVLPFCRLIRHSKQKRPRNIGESRTKRPSLDVAPTTLRLMLPIYSFQFRSTFHPRCLWFPIFNSSLSTKNGTILSCDLELWLTTLTYKVDLNTVIDYNVKYLGQRLFHLAVIVRTQTDTRTQQTDSSTRTTGWSEKYSGTKR